MKTSSADIIIAKFGGVHATARALGHPNASTVQGWRNRGSIPATQHQRVWDAGRKAKVGLELLDFVSIKTR